MPILFKKPFNRLTQIKISIGLIIILILLGVGTLICQNHFQKVTDNQHKQTISKLATALETFYLSNGHGFYPPLASLQNDQWLKANLLKDSSGIEFDQIQDVSKYTYTNRDVTPACTNPVAVDAPTAGCADFKLMIKLRDGSQYIELSHNGL